MDETIVKIDYNSNTKIATVDWENVTEEIVFPDLVVNVEGEKDGV